MNTTTELRLGFLTSTDKRNALKIKSPISGLTAIDVITAMDAIIASGALSDKNGPLAARTYARLVTTNATDIDIS